MHYRRWGISIENLTYFLFLRAVVNIPIQTSIISPWLIFRKMIISQLELGIFIGNLTVCFITDLIISQLELGIFIGNLTVFFITERGRKYSHTNSHDFTMALILQDDDLTAGAWATVVYSAWVYHHKERDAGLLAHQQCGFYVVSKNVIKSYKEPIDLTTQSSSIWSEAIL